MSGRGGAANATRNVGRNDPCPCGSELKFKRCCQAKQTPAVPDQVRVSPDLKRVLQNHFLAAKQLSEAGRWPESIPLLREIARLDPNSPHAHHDLGITYLRCGRLADAAASLQRAIDLRPGFRRALPHLAHVLDQEGRAAEAALGYHRASRAFDDPADRRYYRAKALALEGKLEEAETQLRQLLVLAPRGAGARGLLGQILSQRGCFGEAVEHLSRAIELAPEEPGAFADMAAAKRMTEADRPLVERFQEVVKRHGLDVPVRTRLHFGLGKALDDLGDYEEAMRHYEIANRLKAALVRLDRAALVRRYDDLMSGFTAEVFERAERSWARPTGRGDDMPVFIVGMLRSGTTLVEQVLSSHKLVGAGGELHFWWDISRQNSVKLDQAAEAYRALLRQIAPEASRVTDKAPTNFERIGLIRLALPNARIIHCRRNPVDTCLSIFCTDFKGRQDYAYDRGDLVFFFRQYQRLMDHWRRVLRPDRFIEVEYERLIADQEAETRRLVDFCGLDWDDACLAPERNTGVVNTASVWQARQPVYATSVERWRRYEPWLGELRQLLPTATRD